MSQTTVTEPNRTDDDEGWLQPSHRRRLVRTLMYVVAIVVALVILVPLSFAILGGFRSNPQLVNAPVALPDPWIFDNYATLLQAGDFWRQTFNSTLIALLTAGIVIPTASLAAFVLARYPFRLREPMYGFFVLGLLFPVAVAILPLFVTLRQLDLLSNPLGVVLPQAAFGLPIAIVVMRPFFKSLPDELSDAALIDGCSPLRFYWSVILPLSRPVLSTVAIVTIVTSWNAFLLPLLVLIEPSGQTLPIGVNNISSQFSTDYSTVLAFTTLSMLPALIFYAIAERQIISGLTSGAVKE